MSLPRLGAALPTWRKSQPQQKPSTDQQPTNNQPQNLPSSTISNIPKVSCQTEKLINSLAYNHSLNPSSTHTINYNNNNHQHHNNNNIDKTRHRIAITSPLPTQDHHSLDSYQHQSSIRSTDQDYSHQPSQKTHSSTQPERDTRMA
jgi:hypothetical protein